MASNNTCIRCNGIVTKRMHAVCCNGCDLWQHRKCKTGATTGVTTEQYRQMRKGTLTLKWKCSACTEENMEMDTRSFKATSDVKVPPKRNITASPVRELNTTYIIRSDIDSADEQVPLDNFRSFNVRRSPIDDSLLDPPLDDVIPIDVPVTFQVVEGGSKRGGQKLVSSHGYTYTRRKVNDGRVYWTCSIRSKKMTCYASVKQFGDLFTPSLNGHQHPADPGALKKVTIATKVKKVARENVFRPASDIVESVMKEMTTPDDFMLPKPNLLIRAANLHRQKLR